MNLNKMRGNGQPQKKRSGVRLLLSMLVIMSVVFLLTACSISVGDIGFEITSIDNDGNVTATVTLSNINRDNFLENDNHLDSISIYYAYTEAKAAALAYYAGINPGGSVNVYTHEYDGFCSVNISGEENNAFKTDATAPTSFTKQLSFKLPAEAKEKNIAFLVVLSGSDSDDGWGSSGAASSVIFNYTWNIVVTEVSLDKNEAQNIDVGGTVSFTASFQHNDATDRTVLWSVGGANAGAVKLYSDETCDNEVGVEATETLTVYAKGISAGLATVTATSNADSTKSASCNVTVNKADPTAPTGLTATYGQTLADVTLPDGWTWVDSAQSVGSVVSPAATFKANFAGDDNHNAASNVDVTVTVGKANAVAATVTANNRTYDGTEKPLVTVAGETIGGTLKIAVTTVDQEPDDGAYTFDTTSIPTAKDAGTYYVWVKAIGDGNHENSTAVCVTVEIGKKAITISGITAADKTYDKTTAATLDYTGIDWTACGMVAGDALTITANGAFADVNAETGKTVNISGLTLGGSSIANYELAASGQQTTTTANIDKKAVTITADDKSSKYKEAILELTYQITSGSILSGDDLGITLSTTATSSSWVAEYEITISWNNNANYDVTLVAGTYAITRTDLSVSASGYTGTYDGGEHGITVNLSGNEEAIVYYAETELTKENFSTAGSTTNPTYVNAGTHVVYYYVHTLNYEPIPLKGSQTVNITKAAVTISQIPTASGITYGQSLSDSTLTGGVATYGGVSVVGTFAWKVGTTKPSVADGNVTEYEVVFTPADAANYVGATCKVKLSVSKADPAYTIPTGLTAVYGQTLGDVGLPTATNGTWSFEDALATSVGNAGTNTFQMTFTPSDVSNYNVITGINITLTVTPATITGVSAANVEVTYDGAEHGITVTGMPEGTIVTYGTSSTAVTQTECPVFVNAANEFYVVYYQVSGSNYVTYSSSATVKINRREVVVSGILAEDKNYDENTNATLKLTQVSFANLVASDVGKLGVTASGSFEDANVGKGKKVLITGLALNGEAAGNYVLAASGQQTMAIADISYMTTVMNAAENLVIKIKDFKGLISNVSGLDLTLAKSLLTPAELAAYGAGSEIVLELEITEAGDLMTSELAELITNAVNTQKKQLIDGARYLDISLYKTIGGGVRTKVTDLGEKTISITISVPEELRELRWNYLKIFYVVREHGGAADVLYANNSNELTFESNLFSIYALAYKTQEIKFYDATGVKSGEAVSPKTYEDGTDAWVFIFLGTAFAMAVLVMGTYRFRRKRS